MYRTRHDVAQKHNDLVHRGRHLRLIVIVLVAKKKPRWDDEYCDPFFRVTQNKTKQSTNILFVYSFSRNQIFCKKDPYLKRIKWKKHEYLVLKPLVFYTLGHFLVDYPKWYNISLDTTPALHFHNNARLLTPFLCTWYDLWPFLTLHWRNVSTTEKCIIIVHRASSSPLLCPHLKPPTFHFFNPPEVFLKGQFNFQKQYAPRVYINSSSVTIWILVEVRWAITSIVTFMDGYFGPTHMVFLNVQYLIV